jgi:hypothetical protein
MSSDVYRYQFAEEMEFEQVEATLMLAIAAAESLHGAAQVRLEVTHTLDHERRVCVIDASSNVSRDLNRLFTGFIEREFGPDAFRVERRSSVPARCTRVTDD